MRIKERRTKPHTKGTSGKCKKKKKIRSEYLSLISANQVDQRVQDNQQVYKVLAYSLGTPPMTLVFFSTIPFWGYSSTNEWLRHWLVRRRLVRYPQKSSLVPTTETAPWGARPIRQWEGGQRRQPSHRPRHRPRYPWRGRQCRKPPTHHQQQRWRGRSQRQRWPPPQRASPPRPSPRPRYQGRGLESTVLVVILDGGLRNLG
jgi:hypothetical protein